VVGVAAPAEAAAGFADVSTDAYYAVPVQWMVDNGITTGTSACTFDPDAPVTRGELAALMWRAAGRPGAGWLPFGDISASWQREPVAWMVENGITTGTGPGSFSPDATATRGQIVVFLWRQDGSPTPWSDSHPFVDVDASWQHDAVTWSADRGITTGTTPWTFSPDESATRGQVATFLWRYYGQPWASVSSSIGSCPTQYGAPGSLPSSAVVDGQRVAALWPFTSDSPWNTPLGVGAAYASPFDGRVQNLRSGSSYPAAINIDRYSHQMYRTTTADPLESVWVQTSNASPNYDFSTQYRIPTWASPSSGSDGHMHIVQPDGRTLDENWVMSGGPGGWSSAYWVRTDLYSDGLKGGTRAYGGSAVGGLVRDWELEQGRIDHAIAVALRPDQLRNGPVWPATREDGGGTNTGGYWGGSSGLPMGSLLAIASDVDLDGRGLSPAGLAIARAFQNYGGYVVDQSASTVIAAVEPSTGWQYRPDNNDAAIIQGLLTVVDNNSAANPGGPGARRVGYAPPLQ
jgi:hypothetical protein